jgi:hypothetical protein
VVEEEWRGWKRRRVDKRERKKEHGATAVTGKEEKYTKDDGRKSEERKREIKRQEQQSKAKRKRQRRIRHHLGSPADRSTSTDTPRR